MSLPDPNTMPLRDFHGDLEWLEHELKADAARFADACGHLLHLPAALVSPGHSSHHVEHDVHEAHGALEISRAAVAAAAAARAAAAAARPVATRRGRGRAQQQPPPAVVHGLEPATAKGMQLAGLPAKPTGLALLAHPLRWSRSTRTLLAGAVSGCVSKTATAPIEARPRVWGLRAGCVAVPTLFPRAATLQRRLGSHCRPPQPGHSPPATCGRPSVRSV